MNKTVIAIVGLSVVVILIIIIVIIYYEYADAAVASTTNKTNTANTVNNTNNSSTPSNNSSTATPPIVPTSIPSSTNVTPSSCAGYNGTYNFISNVLTAGQNIPQCSAMQSADKSHFLATQSDGNLVLYSNTGGSIHNTWASNTNGAGGIAPFQSSYQGDGNFVLYDSTGRPLWASNTNGKTSTELVMQEDGNLVIYNGTPTHSGSSWSGNAVWSTGTNGK